MEAFDPYYNWLGIPPRDQPPNHYRLLGVELFESHPDVIQNASDRQMAHLRTLSTGKRAAFAQTLLNQVAAAKICLLDPARKAIYDASLQVPNTAASVDANIVVPIPAEAVPSQLPDGGPDSSAEASNEVLKDFSVVAAFSGSERTTSQSKPKSTARTQPTIRARFTKNPTLELAKIIGGGILGLTAGFVVLYLFVPEFLSRSNSSRQMAVPIRPGKGRPNEASGATNSSPPASSPDRGSETLPPQATPQVSSGNNTNTTPASQNSSIPGPQSKDASQPITAQPIISQPIISNPNGNSTPTSSISESNLSQPKSKVESESAKDPHASAVTPSPQSKSTASIPESVDLPKGGTPSWQTLFPVSSSQLNGLELVSSAVAGYSNISLSLDRKSSGPTNEWSIRFEQKGSDGSPQSAGEVARLHTSEDGNELQFLWAHDDATAIASLRNSWLTFYLGNERKWVALRTAKVVGAPKLDFNAERLLLPLTIEDCPPVEQLELEIPNTAALTSTAKFRKDIQVGKVDRNIVVEFSDLPGAEIRFQLKRSPPAQFTFIVMPRFKETASQEFDLTFPQLEKTRKASERSLQDSREKIAKREAIVKQATTDLKNAKNARGSNANERERLNVLVNTRLAFLRESERQLRDANVDLAKAQARLQAVTPIETFLNALQDKAIPFRVLVRGSSHELVLIEGRGATSLSAVASDALSDNAPESSSKEQ